jgi:transposase InsO family protein
VIPEKLQKNVLMELHRSHLGIVKTKAEVRSRFWFPGVDAALEKMISSCSVCIQQRPTPARAPLAQWEYPPSAFYRVHCDFLGPINGCTYLVMVDAYTKWVEVYNMRNTITSAATIDKLCEFMSRFGIPHTLVSDNGASYTSREFKAFCALNGISHVTSPAYSPASNGQAESYVKIIKKGIKTCLLSGNGVQNSCKILLKYLFDYRNSVHTTTGVSPAELLYGWKLKTRLDLINPKLPSPSSPTLADTVRKNQCLQSKASGGGNTQCFSQGDFILFKTFTANHKYKWCRGTIVKKIGKVVYIVRDKATSKIFKKHKNQMVLDKGYDCAQFNRWDTDEEIRADETLLSRTITSSEEQQLATGEGGESTLISELEPAAREALSTEPAEEPRESVMLQSQDQSDDEEFQEALPGPATNAAESDAATGREPAGETSSSSPSSSTPQSKRNRPKVNYKQFF